MVAGMRIQGNAREEGRGKREEGREGRASWFGRLGGLCFEVIGLGWEAAFFDSGDEFCWWPEAAECGFDSLALVGERIFLFAVFAAFAG
jgi:hypothetical protein